HPETCGFSFGSGQALWRNSGDCARLYDSTGALVAETCGFSFGSGQALWRNSGDCARLYDSTGALVAETCY
ncbi:MAG TPA: hypothetical protein VLC52_10250, partial [Anaerolineae bacterium]|nr:hypothetical protein [Anaerolineae bacterium]